MLLRFNWIADTTNGSVPQTALTAAIKSQVAGWFITKVIIIPGLATHIPQDQYDITLVDNFNIDLADSALMNLPAAGPKQFLFVNQIDNDGFTFTLASNNVTTATGSCLVYINR